MVSLQVINAREAPLTDSAAKVLLGGLHVGPSGRKGRSGVNESVKERKSLGGRRRKTLRAIIWGWVVLPVYLYR
jgi:hypothetical protein